MITNGTILPLDIGEVADRFDFIRISLDAATPKTYARLKGVDYFHNVIENIHEYLRAGVARVGVSFVVQKLNLHEVPAIIEMLAPVFYAYPHRFFLKFKNLRAASDFLPPKVALSEVFAQVRHLRDNSPLLETFLELGTNYRDIVLFYENTDHKMPQAEHCYYSLLYCLVRTNGDIYPCGLMSRKETNCLGNILCDSWMTICERQWKFSTSKAGAGHPYCAGCWDDRKNLVIQEILDSEIMAEPSLTRLGGIESFYCRW
jgi:radical SAM protein with 4Fe4S-binding SPASM domain